MATLRCRLCALESTPLITIEENVCSQILTLFQISIGGIEDNLSCYICLPCKETVSATWLFLEKIQHAQEELVELAKLALEENLVDFMKDEVIIDEMVIKEEVEVKVVRKSKSKLVKKASEKDADVLSGVSDCELNEDGSLAVMNHTMNGWDSYPWVCCECGHSVLSCEELREHYGAMHEQPIRFACADCPKIYSKYFMFLTHVRSHQPHLKFNCEVCNKWFATAKRQEQHRMEHGDTQRPHACETCGKRFRMQSALAVHSRSHLPAELKNRHQCDQCPKRFGTRPNLMAHKRIHTGIREFTCDQCGKSFVQKGNLDNHLLTHTVARPYTCSTCGKSFKTLMRLRKHGSVHSGLKPHQCDVCGRQFRERGTLKEHYRIHTGAMPFTCEFCGKNFRFKGVLTIHRRQHTGERPYSCLECQHHFTNWPNYNKHMKRRHGINTSVTVRKPQSIPPTGMPPQATISPTPNTVLVQPQQIQQETHYISEAHSFYPVLNIYNISDELMQNRTVQ